MNEVKSFITKPSPGVGLKEPGLYEISALAYSGKGRITKVMVSADRGQSWGEAALQEPVLSMAFTRFRMPWRWNGGPAVLQSRAWDDGGNGRAASCRPCRRCSPLRTITSMQSPVGPWIRRERSPMFTLRTVSLAAALTFAFGSNVMFAAGPDLGKPISQADAATWDIDIEPSGAGLPSGSGTSDQGAPIFAKQCSACHGDGGLGATTTTSGAPAAPPVVSDVKRNGIDDTTLTIANYWPYATTLFDYIRRSMPKTSPQSLTDDQVYALTAYVLVQNKLIDARQVINALTLPKVEMPNRNGFIPRFPERMPPR